MNESESVIKAIAFYLPQFHPIPENDAWWGKGFTEWTNVARAKPLFPGHYQPHLPADLGFYDLRVPEVRAAQAALAREYGVHGFCYYHYWFQGRRLLERPFNEVLASGEPDFPFCLCWANENWTRRWDGQDSEILMEQTYSEEDDRKHIRWLCEAFTDPRYIRVNDRPLFLVYRANQLPDPKRTTALWRETAARRGFRDLYLCNVQSGVSEHVEPNQIGFDAAVEFQPDWGNFGDESTYHVATDQAQVFRYNAVVRNMMATPDPSYRRHPCVVPAWDNVARRKMNAIVLHGSTPTVYEMWLREALKKEKRHPAGERMVFINAWNEWAEGNHLEPDLQNGHSLLEATSRAVQQAARTTLSTLLKRWFPDRAETVEI